MSPEELAADLRVSAKALRAWLRRTDPRSPAETRQRWRLDVLQVEAARVHFGTPTRGVPTEVQEAVAPASIPEGSDERLEGYFSARLFTRSDVLASPCPVPAAPGVYGWWFRRMPTELQTAGCRQREGCVLLYVGISPKRPPGNGRAASTQTLRDRVRYHYSGNAEGSTLRKTLGCLLSEELDIELRRVGAGNRLTFGAGEQKLSAWMAEYALVSWVVDSSPWLAEHRLIGKLDLPLNLEGNARNRFHRDLTSIRATAVARARATPAIPNPGVGGR